MQENHARRKASAWAALGSPYDYAKALSCEDGERWAGDAPEGQRLVFLQEAPIDNKTEVLAIGVCRM